MSSHNAARKSSDFCASIVVKPQFSIKHALRSVSLVFEESITLGQHTILLIDVPAVLIQMANTKGSFTMTLVERCNVLYLDRNQVP